MAYAKAVVAGDIVAGPHVRNACKRHIADLKRKDGIWFDQTAANLAFAFFEEVLKLSVGQFEGEPFELQPSQAFIVGSLFGWKRKDGRRRFRRTYIEQGKGNGKSPVTGGIGIYGMTACQEAGAQIYTAAAKKEQANIPFRDAVRMVRQSPALARRLEFSGGPERPCSGATLLRDAVLRTLQAANLAGIRALVVHAKDEAAAGFYRRYNFATSPTDPLHLFALLKDLKALEPN